jgi:glycosyltransferase involved in cell wall biosynthesis
MARVLLVLQEETLGGATRTLLRPVDVLRERGWDVSFWCAKPSPLHDDLVAMGHAVDGAPRLMRYRWRSLRHPPGVRARVASLPRSQLGLRAHLRSLRPDLVHVNGRLALPEAATARASGFRVATFIVDDALPGLRGLVGRVAPWTVSHAVLAMSPSHAAGLTVGRRVPGIVPGSTPLPAVVARRAKPPGAPVVVGTIGVLSPRKGTDVFVDAAERLRGRAEFRIAGPIEDGPDAPWAREQVARGEAAGVRYLGPVDVSAELPGWDVMVLPSRAEPFGLVVSEAMAAGVAVVGSAVDGIAEQLDGGVGVLVAPGDAAALAAALEALIADPARRAELGAAGHARVLERYTPECAADALEAAWRVTLGTS